MVVVGREFVCDRQRGKKVRARVSSLSLLLIATMCAHTHQVVDRGHVPRELVHEHEAELVVRGQAQARGQVPRSDWWGVGAGLRGM